MSENKERILFLFSIFIILIIYFFSFSENSSWKEVENNDYIFNGKYLIEELNIKKLSSLPKISENNAKEIMKNIKLIKKRKDFKFINGIGKSKNKILKKFIEF